MHQEANKISVYNPEHQASHRLPTDFDGKGESNVWGVHTTKHTSKRRGSTHVYLSACWEAGILGCPIKYLHISHMSLPICSAGQCRPASAVQSEETDRAEDWTRGRRQMKTWGVYKTAVKAAGGRSLLHINFYFGNSTICSLGNLHAQWEEKKNAITVENIYKQPRQIM